MTNKKYMKFIFILPTELSEHLSPTKESMSTLLDVHLSSMRNHSSYSLTPGLDILSVPEDLFEHIVKQKYQQKGALDVVKSLSVFPDKNVQVLSLDKETLSKIVTQYEEMVKQTLENLTINLSELTKQVHIVSKFKELFLGKENVPY